MRMDVPNDLATESFSFSWLPPEELKPSNYPPTTTTFHFDVSNSPNSSSLVDADKLFSDGLIMPRSLSHSHNHNRNHNHNHSCTSPGSVAVFPSPSAYTQSQPPKLKKRVRRILSKYMGCLLPVGDYSRGRTGIRVDDVNRRAWEVNDTSIHEAILYCKRSSAS